MMIITIYYLKMIILSLGNYYKIVQKLLENEE